MNNLITFILFSLIIYLLYQQKCIKKNLKENMTNTSNVDFEAIKNLATVAKGLTKDGYKVPGDLIIDGLLKVKNKYGSIEIGARGPNWAHIFTDRPKFAFNKKIWNTDIDPHKPYINKEDTVQLEGADDSLIIKDNKYVFMNEDRNVISYHKPYDFKIR